MTSLKIKKRPFIIAEIGNNHEGSFRLAKKLILKAADAGVDAVKFQTFVTEDFINTDNLERYKRYKKFQLSKNEFKKLYKITKKKKLKFISTPLDLKSADFLGPLVDFFKISSGDNNFYQLIDKVLSFRKPTIISTGFLNLLEIKRLVKFIKIKKFPLKKLSLLHCVSDYPVKKEEANLNSIKLLKDKFNLKIGYSDHTVGIDSALIASIMGAEIIEKHFTLDKNFSSFRDHQLSADPEEMKKLVEKIEEYNLMMGKYEKKISHGEKKNLQTSRRSIYAKKPILKNKYFLKTDLSILRPGKGYEPKQLKFLLNKRSKKNYKKNELI